MGFFDFLFNGIKPSNQRQNHPEKSIEAINSSFSYKGEVTQEYEQDDMKVRVIDNAIVYKDVKDDERNRAKAELSTNSTQGNIVGALCLGGLAYSVYQITEGYTKAGIIGSLASLGFATLGLSRASDAQSESQKWNAQTKLIGEVRVNNSRDLNSLMKQDLTGTYFTYQETQDVFHQTNLRLKKEYNQLLSSTDPELMAGWVDKFVIDNPLRADSIEYAFGNQRTINNPKEPADGLRKREDLNFIVEKSQRFNTEYLVFKAESYEKSQEIKRTEKLGCSLIKTANSVANDRISANTEEELSVAGKKEKRRLARLDQRDPRFGVPYQDDRREIRTAFRDQAQDIRKKGEQNKEIANQLGASAQALLRADAQLKRHQFFAQRNTALINQFSPKIGAILNDYEGAKVSMP